MGVTIIDGVEHPDSTYRCTRCGTGVEGPPFQLPTSWCEMKLEIGMPNGVSLREQRLLCPRCARDFLDRGLSSGAAAAPAALPPPQRRSSRRR